MEGLTAIVMEAMSGYAVQGLNGYGVLTASADRTLLTVVSLATVKGQRFTTTSLAVRIMHNIIVIEHDINNKPLVDALLQAGIPRGQIILAYAGEPVPDSAEGAA